MTARPLNNAATEVASPTTIAICHAPVPIAEISRAPTPTPTLAPTISSTARRSRWPSVISMETMAATGANNGAWCPKRCAATNQERPAANAVWATGTATLRQQLSRPSGARQHATRSLTSSACRWDGSDIASVSVERDESFSGRSKPRSGLWLLTSEEVAMTIVVVHGAWADGSSWSGVIRPLQAKRFKVVAAPIPLTSLSDDVKALDRVLDRTCGPVVLASHAYAGAVISATANVRVKSLVYVAGLTPRDGDAGP